MFLKSYALPPWEFVRGETKEQRITLRHTDGSLYELGAVNVSMDIGDFVNRDMEPVYTGRQEIVNDDNGTSCILKLTLDASVTEKLITVREEMTSMKICENGIYRDMTADEIAELEKLAAEQPAPEPTPEERIAALEKDNAELRDALEALLTGATA